MPASGRVDQLGRNPDPVAGLADAALEDMGHVERLATSLTSITRPLKVKAVLRAITSSAETFDRSVMFSVMPSLKYSCSGSAHVTNGSTQTEGPRGAVVSAGTGALADALLPAVLAMASISSSHGRARRPRSTLPDRRYGIAETQRRRLPPSSPEQAAGVAPLGGFVLDHAESIEAAVHSTTTARTLELAVDFGSKREPPLISGPPIPGDRHGRCSLPAASPPERLHARSLERPWPPNLHAESVSPLRPECLQVQRASACQSINRPATLPPRKWHRVGGMACPCYSGLGDSRGRIDPWHPQ